MDLSNRKDEIKLLNVMEYFMIANENKEGFQSSNTVKQFKQLMQRDGFIWSNGKFESQGNTVISDLGE